MILVFNSGSSSLKYKIYDDKSALTELSSGSVANIGSGGFKNHKEATAHLCSDIKKHSLKIDTVGYRIVHGAGLLENGSSASTDNINILIAHSNLAPLHNPQAIEVIKACEPLFGRAKHRMYFDTDFFKDLPEEEIVYPLPYKLTEELNIRRFGFHGISHKYASRSVDTDLKNDVITIHLGAGCSIAAISKGKPIATSLGFTPDEGLMMQTRSGDIDPGIILYLAEKFGIARAREIIEKESGLKGVSGTDGSMLDVLYLANLKIEDPDYEPTIKRTLNEKKQADLALKMYVRRIQKYIAYYTLLLKKVDKLVFTGNIGAGSSVIRKMITSDLESLPISEYVVVKPDEELAIANEICQNAS